MPLISPTNLLSEVVINILFLLPSITENLHIVGQADDYS